MAVTDKRFRKMIDEPTMSDATLLLKVEDLISLAFGKSDSNVVNITGLHYILNILATQMRILEQDVEIRFDEEDDILQKLKEAYGYKEGDQEGKPEGEEEGAGKGKRGKGGKGSKGGKKGKTKSEREEDYSVTSIQQKGVSKTSITASVGATTQDLESKEEDKAEGSVTRIGSIEVVTPAQFKALQDLVEVLLARTGGVPLPTMPSNEDLLAELAKGTATLTDTMEALQVVARVEIAENVITKMADVLTQMALSGALPPEVADTIAQIQSDMKQLALGAEPETGDTTVAQEDAEADAHLAMSSSEFDKVTCEELHDVIDAMQEELMQNLEMMVAKGVLISDKANQSAKAIDEKIDIARKLGARINQMQSVTDKNLEQVHDFDVVMASQLKTFDGVMVTLRKELDAGLAQLDSINNNAEVIALKALGTGYENLVLELEQATNSHGGLVVVQKQLTDELKGLITCVDLMREEKADRDDVADGLMDKANKSRLKGLVNQTAFEDCRREMETRLTLVHDTFLNLEQKWMDALKELNEVVKVKGGIMPMYTLREFARSHFKDHYDFLRRLETLLGDPKIAALTRKLSKDAYCGPCVSRALMDIFDRRSGAPPELPAMPRRQADDEHAAADTLVLKTLPDNRKHVSKRWVGGSHTLLTKRAAGDHEVVEPTDAVPTKHYTGYGIDGRLYRLEEELEPCSQCRKLPPMKQRIQ